MSASNEAQIAYWNSPVGERWVRRQSEIDAMLQPFSDALMGAANIGQSAKLTVADIGCGSGTTSLLLAARGHEVTGLDVSSPLLELATKRAAAMPEPRPIFFKVDASRVFIDPPFDLMISRFGVMFFADPEAAFHNLYKLIKPKGRLVFVCWRGPNENEWVRAPMDALATFLPTSLPSPPDEPGPFAFADHDKVGRILRQAGFSNIKITPMNADMVMPGHGPEEAAAYLAEIGPAARALNELPVERRPLALQHLRKAMVPYMREKTLVLRGAVWIVEATA